MNKFCVTCRYIQNAADQGYQQCTHPEVSPISPVTGTQKFSYCEPSRMLGGPCGPKGKFWESNAEPATVTPEERKLLMTALEEGRI